ncbi:MAG: metallophosphoesterase family protein, partial [Phycisphaerales bacterium]|nr:metallophosphoesterase family protein [Phycisphaerales bacterium]
PYLQMTSSEATTVRWRTDRPAECTLLVGPTSDDLTPAATSGPGMEHEVRIEGLTPATTMFYAIESDGAILAGADDAHAFTTMPPTGSASPIRMWVLGDSGTADANARRVRDAYTARGDEADLVLMLGDNAYNDGTDAEYQAAVFDTYPEILKRRPLWSTLGNHDGHTADSATQTGAYFESFTFPRQAEVGGLASGTEAYYSFDVANVHFVCLDSYDTSRAAGDPMMTWLEQDLAQTSQTWIIAFWHHPPYSKGSHDSDRERELIDMRRVANPILEAAGVDLVLSGHSHSYERSALIDGHYGTSDTFDPDTMRLDGGTGGPDDPYEKWQGVPHHGAVYAVAGSSGKISGGPLDHPVMVTNLNELGSMLIEVEGDRLEAIFLTDQGDVHDQFVIEKSPCPPDVVPDGVLDIFDLLGFLQWFSTLDSRADWNGDTAHDIFDAVAFLGDFDAGC